MAESSLELDYAERFKDFLRNFRDRLGELKYLQRLRRMISFNQSSLIVDYPDLYRYDTELAEAVVEDPDRFIRSAGDAIKELVAQEDPEYAEKKRRFVPRFVNLFETVKIREIRSEHIGRLVQIDGVITRMLPVKSKLVKAVFLHDKCGGTFTWPPGDEELQEDKLERPPYCPLCGESGGRFILVKEKSTYIDYQKIVVQERPEDVPGGQMPRSIEVKLTGDLVDTARPGDRVQIAGIVRLEPASPRSTLFDIYIEANSIRVSEKELEEVSITREDEERIRQLARDPWVRERIIASIAPSIYGHWDLKEAIALLLFGGVPKVLPDGTRIRGDIHVLFIGDPGMAKSQLLQAAARVAPRAVFTSGKGSTAAGLTAAVLRDPKTGEWYLEAGALVLADGGVAIIDEFDKMRSEDRTAIHEAMEQQSYHRDFEILLGDGRKVRIGELVDSLMESRRAEVIRGRETEVLRVNDIYVVAYDPEAKRTVLAKADRVSRHRAPRRLVRIRFSNGREVTVTPEHPIMVWTGGAIREKPASEVRPGDIAVGVRFYGIPEIYNTDPKTAGVAALLAAATEPPSFEGGCLEATLPGASGLCVEVARETLSGIEAEYSVEELDGGWCRLRICGNVAEALEALMPELLWSRGEARIPARILAAKREARREFLRVYFQLRGRIGPDGLALGASGRGLAEDLQDLLLDFGVYSVLDCSRGSCSLRVQSPRDAEVLLSIAGLEGGWALAWPQGGEWDELPPDASKRLVDAAALAGVRGVASTPGGGLDRGMASRLLGELRERGAVGGVEDLEGIVGGNIRFLRVESVEVVENRDSEWVYDVTVEPYHLFVSHGLVLHNTISISKAGIVARLNARASVLAAGNPKLGLYDPTKSFVDNVNLPPTILSRFDLIFVLRDIPDKRRDAELAAYVLEAHTGSDKIRPDIDPQLLRKYILYARRYVRRIRLAPEAKEMLKDFFTSMRASVLSKMQGEGPIPIPITTRQLEALIRLTEAHARMALREEAGPEDAAEAIRLTLSFLTSVGFDVETGVVDVGMLASGATFRMRTIMSTIQDIIKEMQKERGCVPLKRILEEAEARRIPREKAQEAVEIMHRRGLIFDKGGNQCYALVP